MNRTNLGLDQLELLPTQEISGFDYSTLETEARRIIQIRTNEIKSLMRHSVQDIIDIGEKLIEVKQYLGYGNFRNWLEFEFSWSTSSATKFMQVAEQFRCVNFTHLNITASTLYLIAAPSTPQEARAEVLKRASSGENVSYTKAKEIVNQYRNTIKDKPALENLIASEVPTPILNQELYTSMAPNNKQVATNVKDTQGVQDIKDMSNNTKQVPISIEEIVTISRKNLDMAVAEMEANVKKLTPEQIAQLIIHLCVTFAKEV